MHPVFEKRYNDGNFVAAAEICRATRRVVACWRVAHRNGCAVRLAGARAAGADARPAEAGLPARPHRRKVFASVFVGVGGRMKFTVVAVGKLKERFWADACAEYLKRLQPYAKTQVREIADVDPRKAGGVDGARAKEGDAICAELAKLGSDTHVVLLAIDGKERSSEGLSKRLDSLMLQGVSSFAFVIGGSDGVSDAVRARADELLSFGPITLPHNLARVVLLEQLYRAQKISKGEPYHK